MKKQDYRVILGVGLLLTPFIIFPEVLIGYSKLNAQSGMLMSFVKFAVLATSGECLALRIAHGCWNRKGFGILPKMMRVDESA